MPEETWRPVPGYSLHEISSQGRVRTTAARTGGTAVPWLWLLLILAAAVVIHEADVVNTIATAVTLALCTIPVGWLVFQCTGELRLRRLYDRQPPTSARVQPRAITRGPLAIEAARPIPVVIEVEQARMGR